MARLVDRNPDNVEGDWYVDTRCIDCDVSRQYAPDLMGRDGSGRSVMIRQPSSEADEAALWRAALACPTRSIGTVERRPTPDGVFPWELADGVFLCGHNDRSSFGAHSYFVRRPEGNVLVDSPRFTRQLAEPLAKMGGIHHIVLSHRDDVADYDQWADRFGARVWIHEADATAAPAATDVVSGDQPVEIRPGLIVIPVPGHTRGSVVYALEDRYLFTGDSLAWHRRRDRLHAFRDACWYSWPTQIESLERLAGLVTFEWVLPGHGMWHHASVDEMAEQMRALVPWMREVA